jgi:hypothetical protein
MPSRKSARKRSSAKKKATKRKPAKSKRLSAKKKSIGTAEKEEICFTIMPFGGWLDDYYESIYCPAIEAAGLAPKRADDLFTPSSIVTDIWNYTKKAKMLLADLTGKNPNVFYELGLAHALAKPVILVAESMEDIPFDLRALRIIIYDKNAPNWGRILKDKIENAIEEVQKAPTGAVLPTFLEVSRSSTKPTITPREKEIIEMKQELDLIRREMSLNPRMEEVRPDRIIKPQEARELIASYVKAGYPNTFILEQLRPLGPPPDWILDEIKSLRPKRKKDSRPRSDSSVQFK